MKKREIARDIYFITIGLPAMYILMSLIRVFSLWDMRHDEGISQKAIEDEYKEWWGD